MIKDYFSLDELVCPDVFHAYGETAWTFFDSRLLITLELIRQRLNKPIWVNNWHEGGKLGQRGFRCNLCSLVKNANGIYVSAHMTGQAIDFDVEGCVASEIREYIIKNKNIWPYPLRLEKDTSWVHLDTRGNDLQRVTLFNS
jgi:hypothetical protein